MTHPRRSYDHRIKQQIVITGDPELFPGLDIPRATAMSWIRRGAGEVVALDGGVEAEATLRSRIVELEHRVSMLTAVLRLVLAIVRVSGFRLELARLPDAPGKRIVLGAVERARKTMPIASGLSRG
jgi:hypothetical protein